MDIYTILGNHRFSIRELETSIAQLEREELPTLRSISQLSWKIDDLSARILQDIVLAETEIRGYETLKQRYFETSCSTSDLYQKVRCKMLEGSAIQSASVLRKGKKELESMKTELPLLQEKLNAIIPRLFPARMSYVTQAA